MATATVDIIEGSAVDEEFGRITRIVRVARVTGLTSTTNALAESLSATGMPDVGDAHPDHSDMILRVRIPRPDGRYNGCEVQLIYMRADVYPIPLSDLAVSGGGGLRSVTTNKDISGNRIVVRGPQLAGGILGREQLVRIEKFEPHDTLTISLFETSSDPKAIQRQWKGKVNDALWLGDAEGTWLCIDFNYRLANASTTPRTWETVYYFEYDGNGWNQREVVAEDPSNPGHELPNPLQVYQQLVFVDLYLAYDFGSKFV